MTQGSRPVFGTFDMERWEGKVALVTGASSGIGAATVVALIKAGMVVVGMARRLEKLMALAETLPQGSAFFPMRGDVSNETDIVAVFDFIKDTLGSFHVLVNNAAVSRLGRILSSEISTASMREILDINLMGTVMCCRHAYGLFEECGVNDGHIFNINSIAGHGVPDRIDPVMNIYPSSKNGVTALTEIIRFELVAKKSMTRITSISPGFTETEFFNTAVSEDLREMLSSRPSLKAEDVADAILYVLSTPPHVQITELTIKPVGEPV